MACTPVTSTYETEFRENLGYMVSARTIRVWVLFCSNLELYPKFLRHKKVSVRE